MVLTHFGFLLFIACPRRPFLVYIIHVLACACHAIIGPSKKWTGGPILAANLQKSDPTSQKVDLAQFWQAKSGPGPILVSKKWTWPNFGKQKVDLAQFW